MYWYSGSVSANYHVDLGAPDVALALLATVAQKNTDDTQDPRMQIRANERVLAEFELGTGWRSPDGVPLNVLDWQLESFTVYLQTNDGLKRWIGVASGRTWTTTASDEAVLPDDAESSMPNVHVIDDYAEEFPILKALIALIQFGKGNGVIAGEATGEERQEDILVFDKGERLSENDADSQRYWCERLFGPGVEPLTPTAKALADCLSHPRFSFTAQSEPRKRALLLRLESFLHDEQLLNSNYREPEGETLTGE